MSKYGVIRGPKRARFEIKSPKLIIFLHIRTQDSIYHDKFGFKKKQPYIFHL